MPFFRMSPTARMCCPISHAGFCKLISMKVTVTEAAAHAGVSSRYLSKLFHEKLHIGVAEYLASVRVSQAISLSPECSLTDLALDAGFSSLQHFSRVFREKWAYLPGGISPSVGWTCSWQQIKLITCRRFIEENIRSRADAPDRIFFQTVPFQIKTAGSVPRYMAY